MDETSVKNPCLVGYVMYREELFKIKFSVIVHKWKWFTVEACCVPSCKKIINDVHP